ncbi:MAG: peptidyl-prolyl cis-trans isomerase [Deltaproteobacteria bacterium]|nr:peptidyl-prolyl cis-trans isomerase [Deltaproteobacteria bacterium]
MTRIWKHFLFGLSALACIGLAGCQPGGEKEGENKASGEKKVVARVGDVEITLEDFEARMNSQNPLVRSRFETLDQRKKLLENMVEQETMVQEAMRLGLDQDPEMKRGFKKILARHMVNKEFHQKLLKDIQIGDEEIQKYYDENHDRYHSEAKVRVQHIFLEAPEADAARREEARKQAASIVEQIKAKPEDRTLFIQLAKKHSQDKATKHTGGSTALQTQEEMAKERGEAFAKTAFELEKPHDVSAPLETPEGIYLLRLAGKQAAFDHPLERVRGQIRTTLFAKARGDAYKDFVDAMKKKVGVKVFDKALSEAKLAPPEPGKPMPGKLPPRPGGHFMPPRKIDPPGSEGPAPVPHQPGPGKRLQPVGPRTPPPAKLQKMPLPKTPALKPGPKPAPGEK